MNMGKLNPLAAFFASTMPAPPADQRLRLHTLSFWLARLNLITSVGGSICILCVGAVNFHAPYPIPRAAALLAYLGSILALRVMSARFLKSPPPPEQVSGWLASFTSLSLVSGLAWAIVFLTSVREMDTFESFSTMTIVAAIATSATVTRAPYLPAFFAFTTPIFLSWLILFLFKGSTPALIYAVGSVIYWWTNIRWARQLNATYCEIADLRFRNDDLVSRLMEEQEASEIARVAAEEARDQAHYASRVKSNFLANMSHELRTPLNSILGFSELIGSALRDSQGSPKLTEYADLIHESGQHLLQLINDLLDTAKVEAGKWEMHPETLMADALVGEAVRILWGVAMQANLTFSAEVEPIEIRADRRALRQVLINLLSNAIKFTPTGGKVSVTAHAENGMAAISVTDTGIGIEPHNLDRVLRPFEQIDSAATRDKSGTGLGLSLSKSLTELMGGAIELKSVVGQGTTVKVRLPLAAGEAARLPETTKAP
jgi:signal transduction histidine kinase